MNDLGTHEARPVPDVAIIGGLGHIGLPLGIVLADAGLQVLLYDIDKTKRELVRQGELPFLEEGAPELLKKNLGSSLNVAEDLSEIEGASTVVITTGTPVDEYLNPRLASMLDLASELIPHLHDGQHVMLRSTVYPGTSRRLWRFFTESGRSIELSFCPERVVQGKAVVEIGSLPQIVSGFSDVAVAKAEEVFSNLGVRRVRVSVEEAELAKLFTNAWRYMQFAIANQFFMMSREHGADYSAIYRAMTDGYERAKDFPSPGFAAGPCLLKDTLQLSAFYRNNFQLGQAAVLINEGLPHYIVDMMERDLDSSLSGRTVGILGMAFKADIDDIRDSLSYKLAKILSFHGATVVCSDEYVNDPSFVTCDRLLEEASVIVVGVPHSAYSGLQIPEATYLVDLWGVTSRGGVSERR